MDSGCGVSLDSAVGSRYGLCDCVYSYKLRGDMEELLFFGSAVLVALIIMSLVPHIEQFRVRVLQPWTERVIAKWVGRN